jgi:hypothetical protein
MIYTAFQVVKFQQMKKKVLQILQVRNFIHHNNNIVGFWETTINTKQ